MSSSPIDHFLSRLDARLATGRRKHGGASFERTPRETTAQISEEAVDLVGWIFVLWCQAAAVTGTVRLSEDALQVEFRMNLRHRLLRNDRRRPKERCYTPVHSTMCDLEVLAMDCVEFGWRIARRLHPLRESIETAQAGRVEPPPNAPPPNEYRGRRGGRGDPRSDD